MILDLYSFKLAVENATNLIVICDSDGKILYANPTLERISGFKREEVMGKTPDLWGGQMDNAFYEKMWKTLKEDKKPFQAEVKNKRKTGEIYDARIFISPVLDDQKKLVGFMSIEEDITKEKELDKIKNEFLSIAAHQLRSPLGRIRWYIEMLLSGDLGTLHTEAKETLSDIYENSMRMIILVNELLNISRLDSGRIVTSSEEGNIVENIKSAIMDMRAFTQKKNMSISFNGTEECALYMISNKDLFREVILNLLSNATKYNVESGKIVVNMQIVDNHIEISVADTGIGIPEFEKSKIFTKFFRASNAIEYVNEGTGLGLYIVSSFIKFWQGKVWFESSEGKGTTFYVRIPIEGNIEKKQV